MFIKSEQLRGYIYRVSVAVLTLAAVYGLIDDSKLPVLVAVIAAVFPTALASANTTTNTSP